MTSILMVEDHPLFMQSLTRLLRERGQYEVTAVGSAEQALERLADLTVDLVLIDVMLPGRSGIALVTAVQGLRPALPCLVLSGYASFSYARESMEAGARGYVLKDDVPGILAGIQAALDGGTFVSEAVRHP